MPAEYRLSRLASADLDDIWDYTAAHWSRRQADAYLRLLFAEFDLIADKPSIGVSVPEYMPGLIRRRCGSHYIFYRFSDDAGAEVIRILHVRMDQGRHLPS